MDIVNSILYLIPDAKFSVWCCHVEKYRGAENPIKLGEVLIDWNPTNKKPCPSLQQLEELDQEQVAIAKETRRKSVRDAMAKKNFTIMSNYNAYLTRYPDTTLTAYLDMLESLTNK